MIYIGYRLNAPYALADNFETTRRYDASVTWMNRSDWTTMQDAEAAAADANVLDTQNTFLAIDSGPYVSPRYDVIQLPKVGDEVSMSFNGDSYPQGKIVSISNSLKVIKLDNGKKFYRRKQTGTWLYSRTWSLIPGVHSERNPHF